MAVSPQNPEQHISCLKVEGRPQHDAWILVVTTNEERTAYESRIFHYPQFPNQEGRVALELSTWLVDFTVGEDSTIHALSADGTVWQNRQGQTTSVKVSPSTFTKICGPMETATIAAVAADGLAFLLSTTGWVNLHSPFSSRLLDVTAISPEDIYVCGADGVFGHWDGKAWTVIDLGTNADLLSIAHDRSGRVLVAGVAGLAFIGNAASGFEAVIGADQGLYGLCPYEDGFLAAAPGFGFFFCDGVQMTPFKDGFAPYRLSAVGRIVFAAADGDVVLFTGREWLSLPVY
ncbi:MAG: hypothetical protein HC783_11990 [Rhodobacteraceae bacterium]|nr:hypothetical protein [Paracoccaceae bacterium]